MTASTSVPVMVVPSVGVEAATAADNDDDVPQMQDESHSSECCGGGVYVPARTHLQMAGRPAGQPVPPAQQATYVPCRYCSDCEVGMMPVYQCV